MAHRSRMPTCPSSSSTCPRLIEPKGAPFGTRRSALQKWNPDRPPKYPANGQKPQMRHDSDHLPTKRAMVLATQLGPSVVFCALNRPVWCGRRRFTILFARGEDDVWL